MKAPVLVFASSKGRQSSYEGTDSKAGYFTSALAEVVGAERSRYDSNGNGVIEVSEFYRALKTIVQRRSGGQQTPWLVRSDLIGDFSLF